ncbi:hypothetical protein FF2_024820 [Malus domestica]
MHDLIHDMALWLACDCGKENESVLVHTGLQGTPHVKKWNNTRRVSLVGSHFKSLVETPKSPNLLTLFLRGGEGPLNMIADGFSDHMPTLRVLDLSKNLNITKLPSGVFNLISLQHLNLSRAGVRELQIELKACVRLKYLNLEHMDELHFVPQNVISSFPMLKVLRMLLACSFSYGILVGGEGALMDEMQGLEYLDVLTLSVQSSSCLQKLIGYHKLVTHIQTLQLSDGKNQASFLDISSLFIEVSRCLDLIDMTWLIFAPNPSHLCVDDCNDIEKIIDLERLDGVGNVVQELNPFGKHTILILSSLPRLSSIHDRALPFPYLKEIKVLARTALRKLPLNSTSAEGRNIVIRGHEYWWSCLEWKDEDARNVFLPCFRRDIK